MKIIYDVCYGSKNSQCLDIHLPECETFPVFLYFHGGGLETGDKSDQQIFFEYMTSHGIAVISANYRMYPTAEYPDFIEDAAEASAWVIKNIKEYGNPNGIYIGGSSAGGYISMMLCFDKRWLNKYGISPLDFSGFVHDAGQPTCHFNVLRERGIDTRRVIIDESAPLFYVGIDDNYPPMLFIVSDNDMPNRYEQTMLLISTLRRFGHNDSDTHLKILSGNHCEYFNKTDRNGSIFGQIIYEYIKSNKI